MNTTVTQDPDLNDASAVAEISIEQKETEGLSQGQIVRRRFFRHRGAMISMIVLAFIIILAFTSVGVDLWGLTIPGWWMWRWDEIAPKINNGVPTLSLFPPQFGLHPFGQDEVGRDIFAVVMRGAQQSIMVMVIAGVVATVIGVVIGAVAGY
jgi:peptide/nickel transport system permease protein